MDPAAAAQHIRRKELHIQQQQKKQLFYSEQNLKK